MESDNTTKSDTFRRNQTDREWWHMGALAALGIGLAMVAVLAIAQHSELDAVNQSIVAHQQQIATLQSRVAADDASLSGTVGNLQDQLASAAQQEEESIQKAQAAASRHADTVAKNLKKSIDRQTSDQQTAIDSKLADVKTAATEASSKADGVMTRVDGVDEAVASVKTDLASTRTRVDDTATDLQRARGDLGMMSGFIATNSKEIAELRALGDRNIYEFSIARGTGMQKVGDVQIRLNKSDPKRSVFTMVVFANDKFIEKKDRTANEPVQFYVGSGARIPYEVVVNDVTKDSIKGYLATPKVATASK